MFLSGKSRKQYENFILWITNNFATDTYFIPDYIKVRELLNPKDCTKLENLDGMDLLIYTILGNWYLFYHDLDLSYRAILVQNKRYISINNMFAPNPILNAYLIENLVNRTILDVHKATNYTLLQEIDLSLKRLKNTKLTLNKLFPTRILNTLSYRSISDEMFNEPSLFLFCREHEIGYFIPRQLLEVYNLNLNRTNLSLYHHLVQLMLHTKEDSTTIEVKSFSNISYDSNIKKTVCSILDAFKNNEFINNWNYSGYPDKYIIYFWNHYDATSYLSSLREYI